MAAKSFLVASSLFFYSFWNPVYLPLILLSMCFNYTLGNSLASDKLNKKISHRYLLIIGIVANLALLAYFKYCDFLIENINWLTGTSVQPLKLMLPLAISFFTFQQIAYLVDSFRRETEEYDFLNYCLFVSFFPQLIAGPIVHHKEMMPQFTQLRNKLPNWKNIYWGLFVFSMGLFKKVVIADTFSQWATAGYASVDVLNFFEAWFTTLSYTLQIYFDFSGYTDMAIGSALMFNIKIPMNFNSPYKALNIQEFWQRWHMTLSRWLRDYIYIPLGGNRQGKWLTYRNLLITFLLGGLWHGAGGTFFIWGGLHGFACCVHKYWQGFNIKLPRFISWGLTLLFINFTWIFFRAADLKQALTICKSTVDISNIVLPEAVQRLGGSFVENFGFTFSRGWQTLGSGGQIIPWIIIGIALALFAKNVSQYKDKLKGNYLSCSLIVFCLLYSLSKLSDVSEFLYFQF